MQIIVSTIHTPIEVPNDVDDPSGGTQTIYFPRLNEVLGRVKDGVTAVVDGDDILKGDVRSLGTAKIAKIVEIDSLPSNFEAHAFTYDGDSWAVNDYYALLRRERKAPEPPIDYTYDPLNDPAP